MASKQINIGLPGQVVTADSLQAAFAKVNSNFSDLDGLLQPSPVFTGSLRAAGVQAESGFPYLNLVQTGGPLDRKTFQLNYTSGQVNFARYKDDQSVLDYPFVISSTGRGQFAQRPLFGINTPWDNANLPRPLTQDTGLWVEQTLKVKSVGALSQAGFDGTTLQVTADSPTSTAYLGFHIPNVFATHFGLGSDGNFYQGGYSDGAGVSYKFYTERTTVATPLTISSPALRSLRNRAGDRPDMRDYNGFDTTGNNDCAALMSAAMDDSGAYGYEWNIPAGVITCTSTITTLGNSGRFRGAGVVPYDVNFRPSIGANKRGGGTWLRFAHSGVGIRTIGLPGASFRNFGTFRDQPIPSANGTDPWAPGNFDWDFDLQSEDVLVEDVCMLNPTLGIIGRKNGARITCRRVTGQPLTQGFEFRTCYDTTRLQSTHLWPFWSFDNRVFAWTLNNGVAYRSSRNDNAMWSDNFAIYYNTYLSLAKFSGDGTGAPAGSSYKFQMNNPQADGCNIFVITDSDTDGITATFTGGYCQNQSAGDHPGANTTAIPGNVYVAGANNKLAFIGTEFAQSQNSHVVVVGTGGNTVDLVRPILGNFDLANTGVQGLRGINGYIGMILPRKHANYGLAAGKTMRGPNVSAEGDTF
jgi:hypothetical protein